MTRRWSILVALLALGCKPSPVVEHEDSSVVDANTEDSGAVDSGPTDSGPTDSGPTDSGLTDSGAADAGHDAGTDAHVCTAVDVQNVDLLFMIDDSGSMREEQRKLRREFPRMVRALVTGDIDDDGTVDGPKVESLRVGVVTSDMGVNGMGTMVGESPISQCGALTATTADAERANYGDDGVLRRTQTSVVASVGDPAVDCDVDGTPGDDSVSSAALPAYLTFDGTQATNVAAVDEYVRRASCVTNVGTAGCGFEQQLESVLKAVVPPNEAPTNGAFYAAPGATARSLGHGCAAYAADGTCNTVAPAQAGDVVNAGWFRDDSLLAIVAVTDEDDCSASDRRVFDANSVTGPYVDPYGKWQFPTRCQRYEAALLHPVQRYVDGLLARRQANPKRLVYAVITGVPPTMTDENTEGTLNIQAILDSSEMQTVLLARDLPAGPGQSVVSVPNSAVAPVCTHSVPYDVTPGSADTTAGSTTIANATFGAVVPTVGMGLSGTSIAAGTQITAVAGAGPYTLTVDIVATATATGALVLALELGHPGLADMTSGSATLTNVTIGDGTIPSSSLPISGPGIPAGATIASYSGTGPYTVTLSLPATVTTIQAAIAVRVPDVSAVPGRRMISVARGLQTASAGQVTSIVQSICVDDFSPAVQRILRVVQGNLAGTCVP